MMKLIIEIELGLKLHELLRIFLDSIRDYEHESGHSVHQDERISDDFVKIFIESEDGFYYREIISKTKQLKEENEEQDQTKKD